MQDRETFDRIAMMDSDHAPFRPAPGGLTRNPAEMAPLARTDRGVLSGQSLASPLCPVPLPIMAAPLAFPEAFPFTT